MVWAGFSFCSHIEKETALLAVGAKWELFWDFLLSSSTLPLVFFLIAGTSRHRLKYFYERNVMVDWLEVLGYGPEIVGSNLGWANGPLGNSFCQPSATKRVLLVSLRYQKGMYFVVELVSANSAALLNWVSTKAAPVPLRYFWSSAYSSALLNG